MREWSNAAKTPPLPFFVVFSWALLERRHVARQHELTERQRVAAVTHHPGETLIVAAFVHGDVRDAHLDDLQRRHPVRNRTRRDVQQVGRLVRAQRVVAVPRRPGVVVVGDIVVRFGKIRRVRRRGNERPQRLAREVGVADRAFVDVSVATVARQYGIFMLRYSNLIQSIATRACMIWHASNQSSSTIPFHSGFAERSSAYS